MRRAFFSIVVLGAVLWACEDAVAQESWWQVGGSTGVPWEEVADSKLMVDDTAAPGALQPRELKPDENLLPQLGPWWRWRIPTDDAFRPGHPRLWLSVNSISFYQPMDVTLSVDGDPTTYQEIRDFANILADEVVQSFYTIDLGAPVPAERFVFYPPEGVSPDTDEPFFPNYVLQNYQLWGGRDAQSKQIQAEETSGYTWTGKGPCCPLEVLLGQEETNDDAVTEIGFPLQHLRFFRLMFLPDTFDLNGNLIIHRWANAEMEVYGRGFAPRATWESQVVDLGRDVNFGRVAFAVSKWRRDPEGDQLEPVSETSAGVQVEIQTGRDPTPIIHNAFNDLGKFTEVSKAQWEKLSPIEARGSTEAPGFRGPKADDQENWSFWSLPLQESGVHPRMPWGRYFRLRVRLNTDAIWEYARLESLRVEIAPLLADRVVGEVAVEDQAQPEGGLSRMSAGEMTPVVFEMKAEFVGSARTGFDALRVRTPASGLFQRLEMGSTEAKLSAATPDSVVVEMNGFTVYLPRRVEADGDQRVRLGLEAVLYGVAGKFGAEVFDRQQEHLLQKVEDGDASSQMGTNQLLIVASPESVKGGVLGQLEVQPVGFTPQGDGLNEQVQISYTLFRVLAAAEVEVEVVALNGERVWHRRMGRQGNGRHSVEWDGRAAAGQLVEPGLYLARVQVKTDQGRFARLQPIAVIY